MQNTKDSICRKGLNYVCFLQSIQDNDDDIDVGVGPAPEISDLLGDHEHLYPKILYLVMADSAYCEGKEYKKRMELKS